MSKQVLAEMNEHPNIKPIGEEAHEEFYRLIGSTS